MAALFLQQASNMTNLKLCHPRLLSSLSNAGNSWLTTTKSAKEMVGERKAVFVDVRPPETFAKGHIPGASNIHEIFTYLAMSDETGIKDLKETFQKLFQKAGICGDERVVVYDSAYDQQFGASCRGTYLLRLLGHPDASVLDGGWQKWSKDNTNPISTKANPSVPDQEGTFTAKWNPLQWSDKESVKQIIKEQGSSVLLDVRDEDEWKGHVSSPYGKNFVPRSGRLPYSRYINWRSFLDLEDGVSSLKSSQEVCEILEKVGIKKDDQVIVLCFKGARASSALMNIQRAGYNNVSNYFASWNEWSRDPSLEIDDRKL